MGKDIEFTIHYHGGPKDGATEKVKASTIDAAAGKARAKYHYAMDQRRTDQSRDGVIHVQWRTAK